MKQCRNISGDFNSLTFELIRLILAHLEFDRRGTAVNAMQFYRI